MAYIKTEQVKQIREALKNKYPNIKWSITREHYSNINICILKSDIDFSDIETSGYYKINHYHLNRYPEHHQKFFNDIIDIIKNGSDRKWFDKSDSMTDYFHIAFYFDLSIGKYKKPYINIKKAA